MRLFCGGVHCENAGVIDALIDQAKKEGRTGPENHPLVRPDTLEAEAVHRLLVIAREAGASVMVVHLTNRKAYEEILRARAQGRPYMRRPVLSICFWRTAFIRNRILGGAVYVCAPPIRKKEDQDCLWEALKKRGDPDGGHRPVQFYTGAEGSWKRRLYQDPGRTAGSADPGTLLYTYGVREGKITEEQMCRLLSENAAKLYGVYPRKGALLPGSDADIVVFDPEKESVISAKTHAYNTDNNPFEGFALHGGIDKVFLRGNLAVEDGELKKDKLGIYISRGKKQL